MSTTSDAVEAGHSMPERAQWTTAYVNNLPDSAFLHVEAGGSKDSDGKTVPRTLRHFPYKDAQGNVDLPHLRNALARIPQSNLSQSLKDELTAKAQKILAGQGRSEQLPRDDLYRADFDSDLTVRDDGPGGGPVMTGHFARFGEWTEINSAFEGHFLERIAPGAFAKTFQESRSKMRVLFQHGKDILGQQVLGPITDLREDDQGAYYEVPLFDGVPDLIVNGLRAGQYGSSFRFKTMVEDFVRHPKRSDYNPDGLPERTIKEAQVREFGPVTFPAYAGATAGIRSTTDEFLFLRLIDDPEKLRELLTVAFSRTESELSEATTPDLDPGLEPEPSEATTRSQTETSLFWFVEDSKLKGAKK